MDMMEDQKKFPTKFSVSDEEEDDGSNDGDGFEDVGIKNELDEELFDDSKFEDLNVSHEMKQVFAYVNLYTPHTMSLDFKLKPFVPDFIPAVGDIDAFLKAPRPDGESDRLGLIVLDEPSPSQQSDASLLSLRLRALTKDMPLNTNNDQTMKVKVAKSNKDIDNWIDNIRQLHQETSGAPIQTLRLPDIDHLMQEWDAELEETLKSIPLPPPDLDCDLSTYIHIVCSIVDIPVHTSKVASLHQFFTLYNEFRSSQHFKQMY